MKNSLTKKIVLVILATLITLSCAFALIIAFYPKTMVEAQVSLVGWNEEESFLVGDSFSPPENIKIDIDGTSVDISEAVIIFPDGGARQLKEYSFTMPGEYVVRYYAIYNGETYSVEKTFIVTEGIYKFQNDLTTKANYVNVEDSSLEEDERQLLLANGIDSILDISLSYGDYFRFGKSVNVYDLAEKNGGLVDICSVYPELHANFLTTGKPEANYFILKIIDCYDENNYLEFYTWANAGANAEGQLPPLYSGAGASYQKLSGIGRRSDIADVNRDFVYNGTIYRAFMPDRYVADYATGYYSSDIPVIEDANTKYLYKNGGIQFSWNVENNEVYMNGGLMTLLSNDFINPDNPFKGFTTGEVYAQIEFKGNNALSVNVQVSSLLGLSGNELENGELVDTTPPTISFSNFNMPDNNSMSISIGSTVELPKASALDVNGTNGCQVAVYYSYDSEKPILCNIEDGKFIPTKEGEYTVVYSSTDNFGNRAEEYLYLLVKNGNSFIYDKNNRISRFGAATVNEIPVLCSETFDGEFVESVIITTPNGDEINITESRKGDKYYFIPEYIGEYKIEYLFEKGIVKEGFSYNVNSENENKVYFKDNLPIPSVIIKDATYDIDDFVAYKSTEQGFVSEKADLMISTDNGATFTKVDNQHKFKISANSSVQFKAICNGHESAVVERPIVDVNFAGNEWTRPKKDREGNVIMNGDFPEMETVKIKKIQNFFYGYDDVLTSNRNITYKFDGVATEKIQYATPVDLRAFGLTFSIAENNANFESVSVIIREIGKLSNNGYEINYRYQSSTGDVLYTVKSLDGKNIYTQKTITGNLVRKYELFMTDNVLSNNDNVSTPLKSMDARNIEFALQFNNPTGEFNVSVEKVCNQVFNENVRSEARPVVTFKGIGDTVSKGDTVTLPQFNISMALSPTVLSELSFYFMNNTTTTAVKDVDGNDIQGIKIYYGEQPQFVLSDHGLYTGTFNYNDNGKDISVDTKFIINTVDMVAPVVEFSDGMPVDAIIELEVDSVHTLKTVTSTDDISPSDKIYIKSGVFDERNNLIAWDVKDYKFTEIGIYKIIVFCQDEANNTTRLQYYIKVNAKGE